MTTAAPESNALAVYVCPTCKGTLEPAENALSCNAWQVTYPLSGGIPDFLLKDPERSVGPLGRAMVGSISG